MRYTVIEFEKSVSEKEIKKFKTELDKLSPRDIIITPENSRAHFRRFDVANFDDLCEYLNIDFVGKLTEKKIKRKLYHINQVINPGDMLPEILTWPRCPDGKIAKRILQMWVEVELK